jgi:hypothetical protein
MTEDNKTEIFMGIQVPHDKIEDAICLRAEVIALCNEFLSQAETSQKEIITLITKDPDPALKRVGGKAFRDWRNANQKRLNKVTTGMNKSVKKTQSKVIGVDETNQAIETHISLKEDYYDESKCLNTDESWVYKIYIACCELLYENIADEINKLRKAGEDATVEVALSNIEIDIYTYLAYIREDFLDSEEELNVDDLHGAVIATLVEDDWLLSMNHLDRLTLLPWAAGVPGWEEPTGLHVEHAMIMAFKEHPKERTARLDFLRSLNFKKE